MSRVSRGVGARRRHKRLLSLAKGYRGRRKSCVRVAKQAVVRAMSNSYSSRRLRKRFLRRELILCLNHWSRCYNLCYKQLKFGLNKLELCYSIDTLFSLLRSGLEYSLLMDLFLFCSLS
ncbi:putative 50S ribosomal subunit protein L20 [Candidatus Hodgkinia cicadicola]|nr:putative 50S ribosomal subunit protein L20 [Candidatus Hodgkinia cicadicola]